MESAPVPLSFPFVAEGVDVAASGCDAGGGFTAAAAAVAAGAADAAVAAAASAGAGGTADPAAASLVLISAGTGNNSRGPSFRYSFFVTFSDLMIGLLATTRTDTSTNGQTGNFHQSSQAARDQIKRKEVRQFVTHCIKLV